MSDQEGVNNTPASPAENMVPKQRLDELIQRERASRQETESLRALVQSLVPKPQAQAPKDSPRLQKMKEDDPELYAMIKKQEFEQRRLSATIFAQNEVLDKKALVEQVGLEKANANFNDIERILEHARKSGNFQMTRTDAYLLLRGQSALREDLAPKGNYTQAKEAPAPKSTSDVPPSDIEAQGSNQSAARVESGERNWDEWAAKHATETF